MTDSTPGLAPARRNNRRAPLVAMGTGILGIAIVAFAFPPGINAALDGSGTGAGGYVALFALGALLSFGTVVASLIGLFRAGQKLLWGAALLLGLAPILAAIVVAIVNRSTS